MELYRYIDKNAFDNILNNGLEYYKNPYKWEDTCEGYYCNQMHSREGSLKVLRGLYYKVFDRNIEKTVNGYMRLWAARWSCYAQCWTTDPGSPRMWKKYNNETIRIASSSDMIKLSIEETNDGLARIPEIYPVTYRFWIFKPPLGLALKKLNKEREIYTPFLIKNYRKYRWEKEYRVMLHKHEIESFLLPGSSIILTNIEKIAKKNMNTEAMLYKVNQILVKERFPFEDLLNHQDILKLKIENLTEYITDISVNSQMDSKTRTDIEKTCQKARVKFVNSE